MKSQKKKKMTFWTPEGSKGVSCAVEKTYLYLRWSLKGDYGVSSSGKTDCVGGYNGPLGKTGLKINLNCWRKLGTKIPKDDQLSTFKAPDGLENMKPELEDGVLTLKIDTTKEGKEAASGKNILLATTRAPRKIGETGCTMNVNVYHAPGAEIDMTKAHTLDFGSNMVPTISEDKKTLTVVINSDKKPTKSAKTFMLASTQGAKKIGDGVHSATINIFSKDESIDIPVVPTLMDTNPKTKGIQYTHDGKKLTLSIDLSRKAEPSSSGISLLVASSSGPLSDTKVTVSGSVYKKNPDAPAKEPSSQDKKAKEKPKEKTKVKKSDPTYSSVRKAVAKAMDSMNEDDLTRGAIRKYVAKKNGWDNDANLKKFVSKAIDSLENDDESAGESSDEEGEVKRQKKE